MICDTSAFVGVIDRVAHRQGRDGNEGLSPPIETSCFPA